MAAQQDLLAPHYAEPHRAYHTMDHIMSMLLIATSLYKESLSPAELLAVLYHDAVYNPTHHHGANERASAELLKHHNTYMLEDSIPEDVLRDACTIILDTAHNGKAEKISHRVLDLDMAILGADHDAYSQYVTNVRQEYKMYSDHEWSHGRKQFINSVLKKNQIFYTDEAHQAFDHQARINLRKELELYK